MEKRAFILLLVLFFMAKIGAGQDTYYGELRLFSYNFVPYGWLECNGQAVNIAEYQSLFSVIGNLYGGDGISTFRVPDLRGRVPVQPGTIEGKTIALAETGGTAYETMAENQLPSHSHPSFNSGMPASSNPGSSSSSGFYAVNEARGNEFNTTSNSTSAPIPITVSAVGGTIPRNNLQPYLVLTWCICWKAGYYPMRP